MDTSVPWLSRKWVAIALDVLIVFGVYTGALLLRFDGRVPGVYVSGFRTFLPIICATNAVVGLHVHGYERDRSLSRVAAAALGSGFLIVAVGCRVRSPVFPGPCWSWEHSCPRSSWSGCGRSDDRPGRPCNARRSLRRTSSRLPRAHAKRPVLLVADVLARVGEPDDLEGDQPDRDRGEERRAPRARAPGRPPGGARAAARPRAAEERSSCGRRGT